MWLSQIFFRELPVPVMSHIPVDMMLALEATDSSAAAAAAMVRGPERSLLEFCVTLLALVALRGSVNKMGAKNCGVFSAPMPWLL